MPPSRAAKGKKRARSEYLTSLSESSDDSPIASSSKSRLDTPPVKVSKPKRAVTKPCPVCAEQIPVRLLAIHAELEAARVEEILHSVGSTEVLEEAEPDDGFTARTRRSALKARKSMSSGSSRGKILSEPGSATPEVVEATLRTLKRHRKQRHAKLRDMTREDDEEHLLAGGPGVGTVCPVCLKTIQGDTDVVEAHVDSCLAHEARLQEEREREEQERQRGGGAGDGWEEIEVDGEVRLRVTNGATLRGMGFETRNRSQHDVDGDIDIDGEDDAVYGAVQFTEGDILAAEAGRPHSDGDSGVQVDDDHDIDIEMEASASGSAPEKSLRDLVAEGKVVKRTETSVAEEDVKQTMDEVMGVGEAEEIDKSIELARLSGSSSKLVTALENKVNLLVSLAFLAFSRQD
ncbi:hypothetical protein EIP91_008325 [Steccherinum ochraceum]|uniref:E3 ubiquitin-protein ligase RNF220 middle domain-containing protein n=1 Tax=Steccherinum ochraceum TaxID=92696 RepID=A0A4R0RPX0_9APHY|nr:hypothetical protein EIP91_008325 [Steccherinum ochraceum]